MTGTSDRGAALVVVLLTMALVMAIGTGLVLTTSAEVRIASAFRGSREVFYAAEAATEWALADLQAAPGEWRFLPGSSARSAFADGAASGARLLADGSIVDLSAAVARNPDWSLYAYGRLSNLLPASGRPSRFYVTVFLAGASCTGECLRLHVEAYGPGGSHKILETIASRRTAGVRFEAWTEVR